MVTSRSAFSKKPRSSAIGRPIWSMPVTMPALSLVIVCARAPAVAKPGATSAPVTMVLRVIMMLPPLMVLPV